jgi:anaerobic magnesium-protoporphyrin IX monomethyl ester cyclase
VFTRQGRCQERDDVLGTAKPPLTLAWLSAVLQPQGCAVRLADLTASRGTAESLAHELDRSHFRPTLIIFPSTFPTLEADARALAPLKARYGAALIGFGPQASLAPDESMRRAPDVDGFFVGEPESAAAALAALEPGDDWSRVESLTFRRGTTVVPARATGVFAGFEHAIGPDWSQVDVPRYTLPLVNAPYVLVETSRGCPYTCDFCVAPIHQGHKFRERRSSAIVAEIGRGVRELGVRYFYLWGDTVTLHQKSLSDVADGLIAAGHGARWLANARADNLTDRAFVDKLAASGCWMLAFGVEADSPARRDEMQKRLAEQAIRTAVANLRAAGIRSFAFFILGYPGDTRESMAQTIDYAAGLNVDFASFYPAVPYPGTALHARASAAGWLTTDDWARLEYSHYVMRQGETDEALVLSMVARARRRFFLRPRYLARHAWDLARVAVTKPAVTARVAAEMLRR